MKKALTFSAISLFLTSCFSVSFLEPQPAGGKNLSEFPEKLIGNYSVDDDTIMVTPFSYTHEGSTFYISDSVVARKYRKYTVLNIREDNLWTVLLVERVKGGNVSLKSINKDEFEDGRKCDKDSLITMMKHITPVRKHDNEYTIKPSKKEFKKLIKKNFFRPAGDLKRLEDYD